MKAETVHMSTPGYTAIARCNARRPRQLARFVDMVDCDACLQVAALAGHEEA